MEKSKNDRTAVLRTALKRKISEIDELEKALDRDKCKTFYTSTARLLEDIEGSESEELAEFRRLTGYSGVHGSNEAQNRQWDTESYYSHLKTARSILAAVDESLDWRAPTTPPSNGGVSVDNDQVKDAVIQFLYDEQRQHPMRKSGRSAKYIIHHLNDFEAADVLMAVEYLRDERWLSHYKEQGVEKYRLSSKAIEKFHPSEYKSKPFSAVQITGSNNLIVMGDNLGSISQDNTQGIQDINGLLELVKNTDALVAEQKLDVVSDLETVKAQLLKKKPDAGIIRTAWTAVKATLSGAATIAGAADLVTKVGHFLGQFLK